MKKKIFSFSCIPICLFLNICFFVLSGCISSSLIGQVKGNITDKNGNPLQYASIYQENTTHGTVSNELGEFEFTPENKGKLTLHFQYVGYKKNTKIVHYNGSVVVQNVVLEEDQGLIQELVISANREDPAYPIIRKAILKRSFHRNWFRSFEANLYVKGLVKVLDAPEKILGNDIRDMGGILDSLRQGILYLSESQSKYYYLHPNQSKEVMLFTKKSGTNSMFTANQFSWANINIYDNYVQMSRSVLSPIGDAALTYYHYTLININIDENGKTIYKIKVEPKTTANPLFEGHIYIVGDTWNVHSLDLKIPGKTLKISIIDTLQFKQVFLPLPSGEWPLFSQTMFFNGSFFGFSIGGNFTYIFSNYIVNPDLSSIFTNKETFKVEKNALNQDSIYWSQNRPIPLTPEELKDYRKKDSLLVIWNSKSYQDSMDRVSNKLSLSDVILGYRYTNRFQQYSVNYPDPLSLLRYNVVEGWNIYFQPQYVREDSTFRRWELSPLVVYGFSDNKLKTSIKMSRLYDPELRGKYSLEFGRRYVQYDEISPILLRSNTWSSLFYRQNYIRLYEKDFIRFSHAKEWVNGLFIQTVAVWARRRPLKKMSDFSFFDHHRVYQDNTPNNAADEKAYSENNIGKISAHIEWSPGQTYSSYPNFRVRSPGKGPQFHMDHILGIPMGKNNSPFYSAKIRIFDPYVSVNNLGFLTYNVEWAGSVWNKPEFFQDFNHPLGNEWVIPDGNRQNMFHLLPFYKYSTNEYYLATHLKHHFNGYIIDKIPLLNKTSLKSIISANYLYNPNEKHYYELGIGVENIMFFQFPIGSVEYFWSWGTTLPHQRGFIVKLTQFATN